MFLFIVLIIAYQGEHGVGLVKRDYLPHELGETTVDAMRQVSFESQYTSRIGFRKLIYYSTDQKGLRPFVSTKY